MPSESKRFRQSYSTSRSVSHLHHLVSVRVDTRDCCVESFSPGSRLANAFFPTTRSSARRDQIHLLKERSFWSKVSLFWTFRLADVEGDDNAEQMVVALVFDSWTGSIEISENAIVKVDEIQKPIMGGSWITKTDFGRLEIKIVPYWTGYQYELWHEGKEVYTFFA
ncbi:unnamed protein product [Ectocarpus sp. 12 AP-2014]